MAFIPEFCSDFPLGYQTIAALDGNDALVSATLRVGHDEETGVHTDPAIPSGLVRVGAAFQRSINWAYGCPGFNVTERVGITAPTLLASTVFSDAADPQFVFISTETDTTEEFAYDAYSLVCASRSELTLLEAPMVALWGAVPQNGVKFGFEWPPQLQAPDLNSVKDGSTFSRVRGVELSNGVIAKLTGISGAGAYRIVKVANDGTISAALVTAALTDGTFATASGLTAVIDRVSALELAPGTIPLNGDFETYSSPDFAHWSVVAGTIGTGTDSEGRYIQLNGGADVYSDIFALPVSTPLWLMFRSQGSSTGSNVSVYVRWYDYSQTFISQTLTYGTNTASATYETFAASLAPPAGARFGVLRLKHEANTPKVAWVVLQGSPIQESFTQATVNTGDGWAHGSGNALRYKKLPNGDVRIQGYVSKSTTLTTVGTNNDIIKSADALPAGYRADVGWICSSGGALGAWCRVGLNTSGVLEVFDWAAGGSPASVSFIYINETYTPTA